MKLKRTGSVPVVDRFLFKDIEDGTLRAHDKTVYDILCVLLPSSGRGSLSVKYLSGKCHMTYPTIRQALLRLEKAKYLKYTPGLGSDTSQFELKEFK